MLVITIIFASSYNTYLLDRSLSNLGFILNRIENIKNLKDAKRLKRIWSLYFFMETASCESPVSDIVKAKLEVAKDILIKPKGMSRLEKNAQRLAAALQYSLLKEISNGKFPNTNLLMIEMVKDILIKLKAMSQVEDVKFILKEIIKQKEKKRPAMLLAVDRINSLFLSRLTMIPKRKLEKQLKILQERRILAKDLTSLQDIYYALGNTYAWLSEFREAKKAYRKATDLNPESDLAKKAQFNLAWNEKFCGNLDEAIKEFAALYQRATQEEVIIFSQYQIADALSKKGDYDRAITIYQEIVAKQPPRDLVQLTYLQLGYNYLYNLKDYDKARKTLEEAKKLFKGFSIATHIENKMIPNLTVEYHKEGFRLLSEGYKFSLPEKYKEAEKFFDKALEINPRDGISYSGKALVSLWLKEPDEALRLAREGVKLSPSDEITSVNLGYIYLQLNLVDEAIIEYKRFIAINPFTPRGYYNLGYAYAIQNRFAEAVFAFRQATQIDPKFSYAFNNWGLCLWRMKKYREAIEVFEKAVNIDSNFLDALFNLGWVYKIVGRYKEARDKFERILEVNPTYADAQSQLKEIERVAPQRNK